MSRHRRALIIGITSVFSLVFLSAEIRALEATKPIMAKDAFALIKSLAGEWEGTIMEKDKGPKTTVNYRITGGGSAVMETLFGGTDHEMVTLYHLDGDKLMLTHYCAAGNQPSMVMDKKSTESLLNFTFSGGTNMDASKDMHMHDARIRFIGKDSIETEWDSFKDGKKLDTKKFFLTRKK
jgi:hypothetical protein